MIHGNGREIEVVNEQAFVRVSKTRVERLVRSVLRGEDAGGKGVTLLFTDDRRIRRYHRVHMGLDSATDVISFGAGEPAYLGDVVVSAQTAKRRAAEFGVSARNEMERYAVHGVLHLLGYRDKGARDYKKMHGRQEKYLKKFTSKPRHSEAPKGPKNSKILRAACGGPQDDVKVIGGVRNDAVRRWR